jgi:hypothetical protein
VEESNLKMQMSALRRVLNADRDVIKTVHGRGYVFTSEVTAVSIKRDVPARPSSEPTPPQLGPALPTNLSAWSSPRWQSATGPRMIVPDERAQPVVVVIDDDPDICNALRVLLRAVGLGVESFASVQEFLDSSPADLPGCLVLAGCPDKTGASFKRSWPRQSSACRLSSTSATPMSRCRFGP